MAAVGGHQLRQGPDLAHEPAQLGLASPLHDLHGDLAAELGVTRDQVRYAIDRTNQKFRELLRAEVAEQVGADSEIDDEIREIVRWL